MIQQELSLAPARVSPVRTFVSTVVDRDGAVSDRLFDEAFVLYGERLRRHTGLSHPRMSTAVVDDLVERAFLDLYAQLRTRLVARLLHSPARAARWLVRRVLQYARSVPPGQTMTDASPSTLGVIDTAAPAIDYAFACDLDRLPELERYCAIGRITGLGHRDYAAAIGLRAHEFYRHLDRALRVLSDPICEIDRTGLVRYVNEPALRLLGVSDRAGVLNRPVHAVLHGRDTADERTCPIHETLALGREHHMTHDVFQTASGTRTVEYICRPMLADPARQVRDSSAGVVATAAVDDVDPNVAVRVLGAVITFHDRGARDARSRPSHSQESVRARDRRVM